MMFKSKIFRHVFFCLLVFGLDSMYCQTTLTSDDFNSGWGNWNSGGGDAFLSNPTAINGTQGVNTQDNSGTASSITTNNINLTSFGSASIDFDYRASGFWWGLDFYIEYSDNGGISWSEVENFKNGSHFDNDTNYSESITVDTNNFNFTSISRFRIRCDASNDSNDLYIDNITITGYPPSPEIIVYGNKLEISDGDSTPYVIDNTDFGSADLGTTMTRRFTIVNTGTASLNISSIALSNSTDFSIVGTPYSTPIPIFGTTTFSVRFNSLSVGTDTTTIIINNDDTDENPYKFNLKAEATISFFDSDGDGILDDKDIDDDNDGIEDYIEELACKNSNISVTTNYKFLNETFGTGNRAQINTTYDAVTTYCYEDGTSSCPSLGGIDLNDGEYTVYYRAADGDGVNDTPNEEVGSWADDYWYTGEDHTPNDTNGRMAMFNAAIDPGIFYTASINGALPNVPVTYSFWVLNLDTVDAPGIGTRLRPDILVEFRDVDDNILASITTGDIPPSINGDASASWHNFSADLTFSVSEFNVYFYNNQLGGLGNDLVIDDIEITQTLCDTDKDGIADVFDLDSDNDGIPDVVESGFATSSNGKAYIDTWIDSNGNGMHDAAEGSSPLDSDNDGTPNFLDLDSDNDAIFDVDESGAGNSGNSNFENGDGDIDGDGVGDGNDTDAVREKDFNSDGSSEYFTDGILDIYDYFNGSNMATAYGNQNQGLGHVYYVLDSDNDGLPDYIDTYNNSTSTYDISKTLYANLDSNNDGVIDDTVDSEGDGLLDIFDTNDSEFGSPRDLSMKLQLYFDGRNDYIQDESIIDEWSEITLMGWIKIDPTGTGHRFLFGQNNFYLRVSYNGGLYLVASGTNINYGVVLPTNQWVHVGASYSSSEEELKVYVNGEQVRSVSKNGSLNSDTSLFSIGKRPSANSWYFRGFIDEVRLFEKALSDYEFQKIVYQEIEDNGNIRGTEIPRDVESLAWSNLERYYRLDSFKGDITDDLTTTDIDEGAGAKLYNIKNITYQSAPMPFVSQQGNTDLPSAVSIPADGVNGDDVVDYDWSIVRIEHNDITFNGTQRHLGLYVNREDDDSNAIEYHVTNDSELNVSWYLKLDGFVDLEGESQLVQGDDSLLDPTSEGKIERDQQGTADTFTYNYWSSPVGITNNTSNNNAYSLSDVLKDGSSPENPSVINFVSGHNGTDTNPIGIAKYWIWKFANLTSDDYSAWQHIKSDGILNIGEGFTMKGPGTGDILDDQNYVFEGKPNNGDISLTINSGNDYLIGNPYPSAIDGKEFINDNPNLSGTLYFWEHWGGDTHILSEYQGGYALYNLAGGVKAPAPDPDVAQVGVGTKAPGQYIPVSQGFFVTGTSNGSITFENDQRVFAKESSSSSVFMRNNETSGTEADDMDSDDRMKFRIGFKSSNDIQLTRQILLTIDENATSDVDWAYDALLNEDQTDDMFWVINNEKYIIQATSEANTTTIFPLGIKTSNEGINTIRIDSLENIPNDLSIYLHDIEQDIYHDLRTNDYEILLNIGEYLNRFEIAFSIPESLSNSETPIEDLKMYYTSTREKIVVLNPNLIELEQIQLYNISGQVVYENSNLWQESYNEYQLHYLSTGVYIIKLKTQKGTYSKKIVIK